MYVGKSQKGQGKTVYLIGRGALSWGKSTHKELGMVQGHAEGWYEGTRSIGVRMSDGLRCMRCAVSHRSGSGVGHR